RLSTVTTRTLSNGARVTTRGPAPPGSQSMMLLTTNALLAGAAETVLQPALLIEGTLFDVAGKPVPSAEVIVQGGSGERKTLRTDAKGHFQSRIGDSSDAAVIVVRDGSAPMFRRISIVQGLVPLELRLLPARVLHGRVQDRSQHPVS